MRLDQTVHICRRTTWRPRFYLCGSVGKRKSNAPEVLCDPIPIPIPNQPEFYNKNLDKNSFFFLIELDDTPCVHCGVGLGCLSLANTVLRVSYQYDKWRTTMSPRIRID